MKKVYEIRIVLHLDRLRATSMNCNHTSPTDTSYGSSRFAGLYRIYFKIFDDSIMSALFF